MKKKKIVGAALAVGLTTVAGANAAINVPGVSADADIFAMSEVSSPSNLLASSGKCGSSKCGSGKCGSDKDKDHKCGSDKDKDHKCGSGKDKDHKCGSGKCGSGKCGSSK